MPKKKKKTITHTRQYLHGSAICLRPQSCRDFTIIREEYRVQDAATIFSLSLKHSNTTHNETLITLNRFLYKNGPKKFPVKNHTILFGSDQVIEPDQTKLGSTKPNKSPTWRLVPSPTSTTILQITISHPCNSSSSPQTRRPIEVAHSFNFLIVTPLVSMSAEFLDPQIFSSITSLSSTR